MMINGADYHVQQQGHGPPVLLLHGFTGSVVSWQSLTTALRSDYTVISVDLPGHGLTRVPNDVTRFSMQRTAQDLWAVLDRLQIKQCAILGYSMGGRLALYMALSDPSRLDALLLESASPGLRTADERQQRQAQDAALAERITIHGIASFVDEWERLPLFASQIALPPATRAALRAQRLQNDPHGLALSLSGLGTGSQPSLWERLPGLHIPVTLIVGEHDSKFRHIATDMAQLVPSCKMACVAGAGHAVHLEQPAEFQRIVAEGLTPMRHRMRDTTRGTVSMDCGRGFDADGVYYVEQEEARGGKGDGYELAKPQRICRYQV